MSMLPWMPPGGTEFPPTSAALDEPNGLLAAGGDLSPTQLLAAYRRGIFPWFDDSQPILWWSPSPRLVLPPEQLHVSRSMKKLLRRNPFEVTADQCFSDVMEACSEPRPDQRGTWITDEMLDAYARLHDLGYAHSVEVWEDQTLVGGLYGIALGRVFFGESMFSRRSNASKVGFIALVQNLEQQGYQLIDCQVHTDHLFSLGAREIPRTQFEQYLLDCIDESSLRGNWPSELETVAI